MLPAGSLRAQTGSTKAPDLMQTGIPVKKDQQEIRCIRNSMGDDRHRQVASELQIQCSENHSINNILTHSRDPLTEVREPEHNT